MKNKLTLIFLILIGLTKSNAQTLENQTTSIENNNLIYFEIGEGYYHFRDLNSSDLSYKGLGWGGIGVGFQQKTKKATHDLNLYFEYGEGEYDNKIIDNDFVGIYRLQAKYSIFWKRSKINKKHFYTYGGTIFSDALYLIYPYFLGNNGDTYTIDILSIGPNVGYNYRMDKSTINAFCNLDILSWNFRPQSYNGVSPEKFFSENKITGFYNNFKLNFRISYLRQVKKGNQIELAYNWNFVKNTSTINNLSFVGHKLSILYYLAIKNKQNEK